MPHISDIPMPYPASFPPGTACTQHSISQLSTIHNRGQRSTQADSTGPSRVRQAVYNETSSELFCSNQFTKLCFNNPLMFTLPRLKSAWGYSCTHKLLAVDPSQDPDGPQIVSKPIISASVQVATMVSILHQSQAGFTLSGDLGPTHFVPNRLQCEHGKQVSNHFNIDLAHRREDPASHQIYHSALQELCEQTHICM